MTEKRFAYKLVNQDLTTHGRCQWVIGEWKETDGSGGLCSAGWLHAYTDPVLAVLLNPIHASIGNPRIFKVEVAGEEKTDRGLKVGFTRMRLVEEMVIPKLTSVQVIAFGVLCALSVCREPSFVVWAENWLNGEDRSARAAAKAAADAADAADAAYAADAADAAANATYAAYATKAAANAAANAAAYAAYVTKAAYATNAAAYATKAAHFDLISVARQALTIK